MNYMIQPGNTLYFISKRFNIPIESILIATPEALNPPSNIIC
ncbi:MAG: LysM peptidoglycan-binding domain-containing protein [Clostridiales bacterium]|nr:LysM peptidoglycan-binding domain-containing protein [Clostridiales bacterium]